MLDFSMWNNMLKIPSGYERCIRTVRNNMVKTNYGNKLNEYVEQKIKLGLEDAPRPLGTKVSISETEQIENSTLLRQAEYFGKIARESPLEVKPLLYHYAENSFFGFFVNTLFPYENHSPNHGLTTNLTDNINENNIEIRKNGFFHRIIDVYHLLNGDTPFSPIVYDEAGIKSTVNDSKYSVVKFPKIRLDEIIEMKQSLNKTSNENEHDVLDFLLLFIASSMARYRPSLWRKIVEAEDEIHIIWFNQCFERFDYLHSRLIAVIYDMMSLQVSPRLRIISRYMPPPT
jgi:hypothetical protein